MRKFKWAALGAAALLAAPFVAKADPVGYTLDVTTSYQFGAPAGALNTAGEGPDTGFVTVTNNGTTTFNGTIGDLAIRGDGVTNDSFTTASLSLASGQSVVFAVDGESSNVGGFNGPTGSTQNGVEVLINGNVTDGSTNEAVNLSVFDKDIHSGVARVNPFGITLDNYVLQGGDPLGRDTTDGYETTQANGHFEFHEAGGTTAPLPSSAYGGMALLGLLGAYKLRRRPGVGRATA